MKKIVIIIASICLLLSGCSAKKEEVKEETTSQNVSDQFSERDLEIEYDEKEAILIELKDSEISCDSEYVSIENTTLTIRKEGLYLVRGNLENGSIVVEVSENEKVQIVLEDAYIHNETSAPIYVKSADKVFITLASESENALSNDAFVAIDENNIDAVIYSKADLTINGLGSLNITSSSGHGIVGKDDLVICREGNYSITSALSGINANNSIRLAQANIEVNSGTDGIHAEHAEDPSLGYIYILDGNYTISSQGDGISASAYITIENGEFNIVSGGGYENGEQQTSSGWGNMPEGHGPKGREDFSSQNTIESEDSTSIKGIKATSTLEIKKGSFTINSADDALHANDKVILYNGTYHLESGDDAIHADDVLTIHNCEMKIEHSYEGLEGLAIEIYDGNIDIVASDDGFNAAGGNDSSGMGGFRGNDQFSGNSECYIKIDGGNIHIQANGDGIDSNGSLEINGGYVQVSGPLMGDTSILDFSGEAKINGGTFIGTGAISMAQTFTSSKQGVIAIQCAQMPENTSIKVVDAQENILVKHTSLLGFTCIIISSENLKSGEEYILYVDAYNAAIEAY